jgi:hypothetical protein
VKLLTEEEIAELRKLDAETAPAPWESKLGAGPYPDWHCVYAAPETRDPRLIARICRLSDRQMTPATRDAPDAPAARAAMEGSLIAAARNALPALLSEVERSRALLRRIEWKPERDGNATFQVCSVGCGGYKAEGHKPGCELAALIGR